MVQVVGERVSKGDAILGSMAKSGQMRFALAGGGSVMTVNYGAIAAQLGDLKRCARQTLEGRIGSSTALGYQATASAGGAVALGVSANASGASAMAAGDQASADQRGSQKHQGFDGHTTIPSPLGA